MKLLLLHSVIVILSPNVMTSESLSNHFLPHTFGSIHIITFVPLRYKRKNEYHSNKRYYNRSQYGMKLFVVATCECSIITQCNEI